MCMSGMPVDNLSNAEKCAWGRALPAVGQPFIMSGSDSFGGERINASFGNGMHDHDLW